ncbi:protein kinase domain-containing protein [Nocardia transvalensis]|uniref:serine/threonine-protein kinase n=1 Tax=Nocardia transvalensis TaxID=37333 RepID=UPI003A5CB892
MDAPRSRVGGRFGPYELRSLLGRGGMGEVYEAYDTNRDRLVALKLLPEQLALDPVYQERFRREAQAAVRLDEPHIVPIHDWGEINGTLYIDMRLVRGDNLRTLLRAQGPMDPERAVAIVEQVAAALDAAHADGLVHRDVKPANILVTASDVAYLADFGLARSEGDIGITMVGTAIGSYTYMAPERFDDGPVDGRADIYSLACVLCECLTGATPFPSQSVSVLVRSHLSEPPPRPSLQRPDVPAALDAVIAHAMAKSPADRYSTAGEFAGAARAALGLSTGHDPALTEGYDPHPSGGYDSAPVSRADATVVMPFGETVPAEPAQPTRPEATASLAAAGAPARLPAEPTTFQPFGPEGPTIPAQMRPRGPQPEPPRMPPGAGEPSVPPAAQGYPLDEPADGPTSGPGYPPAAGSPTTVMRTGAGTGRPSTADSPTTFMSRGDLPVQGADPTVVQGRTRDEEPPPRGYETTGTLRIIPPADRDEERDTAGDLPVIRPDDPTLVRPGEFHFTPLPPQAPQRPVPPWEQPPRAEFPPPDEYARPGYAQDEYGYDERGDYETEYQPAATGYADPYAETQKRSIAVPIVLGVCGVALAATAAAVGWHVLNKPPTQPTAASGPAAPVITQGRPATTAAAPPTTTTTTSAVVPPVGATSCPPLYAASGRFAKSATGTSVTSCAFAEEVRKAYTQALDPQASGTQAAGSAPATSVVAISPVTGRSYTMSCTSTGQLVTCTGGENAVVYVY